MTRQNAELSLLPSFPTHVLNASDLAPARAHGRFAATGNPNTDDDTIVHWPAFKDPLGLGRGSNQYLVLDRVIRKAKRPQEDACDFWERYFLRSMLGKAPAGE